MREYLIHTYGLTEKEREFIKNTAPHDCTVSDDTERFTDVVAINAITAVIRSDTLTEADKELFFEVYNHLDIKQSVIIIGMLEVPKYFCYPITFFDTFEDFQKEARHMISRSCQERRNEIYESIDTALSILSCIRFHNGITVRHLSRELRLSQGEIERYIKFLKTFGNWVYVDKDDKIQLSTDQPFRWNRPHICNSLWRRKCLHFKVGDIVFYPTIPCSNRYPAVVSKIHIEDDFTQVDLICEHDGELYTDYCYNEQVNDLNFYNKELTGSEKILENVSKYLKGDIDLSQFLKFNNKT